VNPTDPAPQVPVCQCCPRRLLPTEVRYGRLVCRPCQERLQNELDEVGRLWRELPALLVKGTGGGEAGDAPRAPGPTGSKAPCNLSVLSLLGGGVTDPLLAEEDAWRRELRKSGPCPLTPHRGGQDATLKGTLSWLRLNLHWACHAYPDVDDLNNTLRTLLGEMRGLVSGDRRRREELQPWLPDAGARLHRGRPAGPAVRRPAHLRPAQDGHPLRHLPPRVRGRRLGPARRPGRPHHPAVHHVNAA
jgi:hypothetical protein